MSDVCILPVLQDKSMQGVIIPLLCGASLVDRIFPISIIRQLREGMTALEWRSYKLNSINFSTRLNAAQFSGNQDLKTNGHFTRIYRSIRLGVHVLYAVAMAALIFPWVAEKIRLRLERRWSAGMMRILNVRVHVRGVPPDLSARNSMLIANHISWLDVYLLSSIRPARFVSKSEVRAWPVVGWLAYKVGTFFIDRTRRHDTARVNHEVSAALSNGGFVAIFPEGTTSHGDKLLPFHASLLQPAVHSESKVWPTAIRYVNTDGTLNLSVTYVGEMSFGESLALILGQSEMYAELIFMEPIASHGKTRRELASQAEQAIAAALNLTLPGRETEVASEQPPVAEAPVLAGI